MKPAVVLFSLSDQTFPSLLRLTNDESPAALIDLRISPRFDFDGFNREKLMQFLRARGVAYFDPDFDVVSCPDRWHELAELTEAGMDSGASKLVVYIASASDQERSIGDTIRRTLARCGARWQVIEMP